MSEQYTPTTNEVLWAWAEWRRPFLERDNWFPTAASLREASNAEFQRWLAERDAEVAAKAYERGRLDERHDCNRFQEYRDGLMTEAQLKNNLRSRNPYRKAVQS